MFSAYRSSIIGSSPNARCTRSRFVTLVTAGRSANLQSSSLFKNAISRAMRLSFFANEGKSRQISLPELAPSIESGPHASIVSCVISVSRPQPIFLTRKAKLSLAPRVSVNRTEYPLFTLGQMGCVRSPIGVITPAWAGISQTGSGVNWIFFCALIPSLLLATANSGEFDK